MLTKSFMQLMSVKKIEKIILYKLNKMRKDNMSFIMKIKYDQMLKNIMIQKNESIKMF